MAGVYLSLLEAGTSQRSKRLATACYIRLAMNTQSTDRLNEFIERVRAFRTEHLDPLEPEFLRHELGKSDDEISELRKAQVI
jgi:hypothetical protein